MESTTKPAKAVAFELALSQNAPSEARAALRPVAEALAPRTFFDLTSVVSELVASCIRGGSGGAVRIEVSARGGAAAGAVDDNLAHLSRPPTTGDAERIGRRILDVLCEEWQVVERDQGARVEFRVSPTVW